MEPDHLITIDMPHARRIRILKVGYPVFVKITGCVPALFTVKNSVPIGIGSVNGTVNNDFSLIHIVPSGLQNINIRCPFRQRFHPDDGGGSAA